MFVICRALLGPHLMTERYSARREREVTAITQRPFPFRPLNKNKSFEARQRNGSRASDAARADFQMRPMCVSQARLRAKDAAKESATRRAHLDSGALFHRAHDAGEIRVG